MRCVQWVYVAIAALAAGAILLACAIDPGPFFKPQPDGSASENGRLALLVPHLSTRSELMAFRVLEGLPEKEPAAAAITDDEFAGPRLWMEARREVMGTQMPGAWVNPYRTSGQGSSFVFYVNCMRDAFVTAAKTLRDRQKRYGSSPAFTAWVSAQDQVFSNCGGGKTPGYPDELPSGTAPLVQADREYQIAAAHFYAQDYPEAERRFRAIATNDKSPWQHMSNYLVGRVLMREAMIEKKAAASLAARQQFARVEQEQESGTLAASARGLIQRLDVLEHPASTLESVAKQLMERDASPAVWADGLERSVYLLRSDVFKGAFAEPNLPEPFDWVHTLDSGNSQHAVEQWHQRHSTPWLTLALLLTNGKDAAAVEMIEQCEKVAADSPAFGTMAYNSVRLRMERGESEEAIKRLDALLSKSGAQADSVVNGWRAERMRLAGSFEELLKWAARKPIGADDYKADNSQVLAADSAYLLNYEAPLSKLSAAAHSANLPEWSASDVALAAWTRAFMLKQFPVARDMAPIVAKANPEWAAWLTPPTEEQMPAWRFRAALLVALHGQFQPLVPVSYRKHLYDDNSWWCNVAPTQRDGPGGQNNAEVAWRLPVMFRPAGSVISEEELAKAQTELDDLKKQGSAQNFLAPIVFEWAKAHPDDPLVPQALHRLVVVVRYGCHADAVENGRISKAAFDLLHQEYPDSEWTKQTPYWFN